MTLDTTGIGTIDPVTGRRTPFVTPDSNAFFPIEPERICIDGANSCLQVITIGTRTDMRGVFAVDPANGTVVVATQTTACGMARSDPPRTSSRTPGTADSRRGCLGRQPLIRM